LVPVNSLVQPAAGFEPYPLTRMASRKVIAEPRPLARVGAPASVEKYCVGLTWLR